MVGEIARMESEGYRAKMESLGQEIREFREIQRKNELEYMLKSKKEVGGELQEAKNEVFNGFLGGNTRF